MQCPDSRCDGAFYPCRLCHDEIHFEKQTNIKLNHQLDRHAVTVVKCLRCDVSQPKAKTCISYKKDFSTYFCEICCLYDDDAEKNKVFHCDGCGNCRTGGRKNSFHCNTCQACFDLSSKENHKCVKARLKQDCTICMMDMQNSIKEISFMRCGHAIHSSCFKEYCKSSIACPLCKKSLCDP